MNGSRVDAVLADLRAAGGRVTGNRRLLVNELVASGGHVSAEDLAKRMQAKHPDLSESTVYRILSSFDDLGLVHHVQRDNGPALYHLADKPHAHLVCSSCGSITEAPAAALDRVAADLLRTYGFALDRTHLGLRGRCRSCAADARRGR